VHDVIRLEKAGIPTVNVGTEAFLDEALEQARVLGMPEYRMVWLPHPVAIRTDEEMEALARSTVETILERLLAGPGTDHPA
jgi:hypothetical protein